MARDREKFAYFLVGIPRNSSTYESFMADARDCGAKHLPTLITLRLFEYYQMKQGTLPVDSGVSTQDVKADVAPRSGFSDEGMSNAAKALDEWED